MELFLMQTSRRSIATAAFATVIGMCAHLAPGFADDKLPKSATSQDKSAAANEAEAGRNAAGDLKAILERLTGRDRELVESRIATEKIPEDKREQKIVSLLELPYLGSTYFGSATNQRFFALKL